MKVGMAFPFLLVAGGVNEKNAMWGWRGRASATPPHPTARSPYLFVGA
jgi:hypothetical protein